MEVELGVGVGDVDGLRVGEHVPRLAVDRALDGRDQLGGETHHRRVDRHPAHQHDAHLGCQHTQTRN